MRLEVAHIKPLVPLNLWAPSTQGCPQRHGRGEQPVDGFSHLPLIQPGPQVALHVLRGALQHVQVVSELVQLCAGDHQLMLVQTMGRGLGPSLEVTLTTAALAELAGSADARVLQRVATPSAGLAAARCPVTAVHR